MTTAIAKSEAQKALIEELRACLTEYRFTEAMARIELKHAIGRIVVTSQYYKKYAKGSEIDEIAEAAGIHPSDLYRCIAFAEKYPKIEVAIETLQVDKKTLTWTDVRKTLGESDLSPKRPNINKCHHVWKCQVCGLVK